MTRKLRCFSLLSCFDTINLNYCRRYLSSALNEKNFLFFLPLRIFPFYITALIGLFFSLNELLCSLFFSTCFFVFLSFLLYVFLFLIVLSLFLQIKKCIFVFRSSHSFFLFFSLSLSVGVTVNSIITSLLYPSLSERVQGRCQSVKNADCIYHPLYLRLLPPSLSLPPLTPSSW